MGIFNKRTVVCSCERCHCTCGGCHCCQCGVEQVARPPSFWSGLFSFMTRTEPDEEIDYAPVYQDYAPTYQRPQPRYQQRGCSLPAEPEYLPEFGQEVVPYSGPKFDAPDLGWDMDMPSFQFPDMPGYPFE